MSVNVKVTGGLNKLDAVFFNQAEVCQLYSADVDRLHASPLGFRRLRRTHRNINVSDHTHTHTHTRTGSRRTGNRFSVATTRQLKTTCSSQTPLKLRRLHILHLLFIRRPQLHLQAEKTNEAFSFDLTLGSLLPLTMRIYPKSLNQHGGFHPPATISIPVFVLTTIQNRCTLLLLISPISGATPPACAALS